TCKREIRGLGLDLALAYCLVADVQGERAYRRHRVPLLLERGGEDDVAERDGLGGLDHLLLEADEVVDVLQLAVLDVERMPAEAGALREQYAARFFGVDRHLDGDRVRAVADVRRRRLGDLGASRVVDVAVARFR